jgi:hypothetical protein
MASRLPIDDLFGEQPPPTLILRTPPNWTVIGFLGALGLLHLTIWTIAILHHHTEGYLSLAFGCVFVLASVATWLSTVEIAVLPIERRVRLRIGYRRLCAERSISFSKIRGVRLTLSPDPDHGSGHVELLCDDESISCPPTTVARQEALCLAITLGVRLIKVSDGLQPEPPAPRLDHSETLP